MPSAEKTIETAHARIAVRETSGAGLPVVMIHGNSCCKEVFASQMDGPLGEAHRMIAFDLPGHGASSDAYDPRRSYSMAGYSDMVMELLGRLGVDKAVVFGWSLGGFIALELIPRFDGLVGLMIAGTPPVHPTPESLIGGYRMHPAVALIGQEVLSEQDQDMFAETIYGPALTPHFRQALRRTDGVSRRVVMETAFDGSSSDQRALAEKAGVPIAIVNGAEDPIINVDYVQSLTYATLWQNHCYAFRGAGHASFLTHPQLFNPIFEQFVKDMAASSKGRMPVAASKVSVA